MNVFPFAAARGTLTLEQYAAYCKLPVEWLADIFGIGDHPHGGIELPYGYGCPVKRRLHLHKEIEEGEYGRRDRRFAWPKGAKIAHLLYGVEQAGIPADIHLVEGESDVHVLTYAKIPALGLPGVKVFRHFQQYQTLGRHQRIFVTHEPGEGGDWLMDQIRKSPIACKAFEVSFGDVKDARGLWCKLAPDRAGFIQAVRGIEARAISLEPKVYVHAREPEAEPAAPPDDRIGLPDSFWKARPLFSKIRALAHWHGVSAEAVLIVCLVRTAAFMPHQIRLYSRHQPTRCNLLAAIVGASALGKSSILFPARALVPAPDGMLDDIPLGTGEGIAELYLSEVTTGTGKDKKTERKQTRHNLFQYCDEGATLRAISERKGSLLTTQLRTTFSCGTLGQANASKDRTRVVRDYCYGGVFNFTYGAIAELIKGAEGGLPGRFLFAPTIDTTIPRKPVICDEPKVTVDIVGDITFPSEIFDQIQHDIWLRNTGQKETDPLSDHLGWVRSKLTGVFAVWDDRTMIDADDWTLAGTVVEMSCRVRDQALQHAAELEAEAETKLIDFAARRTEATTVAGRCAEMKVGALARRIATKVHASEGLMTHNGIRRFLKSTERHLLEQAITEAEARGWIVQVEARHWRAGESKPR